MQEEGEVKDLLGRSHKTCTGQCRLDLPMSAFRRNERYTGGFTATCISCYNLYRAANPPSTESARRRNLKHRYGLTPEQLDQRLDAQDGSCAICRCKISKADKIKGRMFIDHDHACCPGKSSCGSCLRGLLCFNCNTGLGKFNDDPSLLAAAAEYLLSFRKGPTDV